MEKNGRDKTGLEEKMRKDEGKRLLVVLIGDHCPIKHAVVLEVYNISKLAY